MGKKENNKIKTRRDPISFALCFNLWRSLDVDSNLSEKIKLNLKLVCITNCYSILHSVQIRYNKYLVRDIDSPIHDVFVEIFIYLLVFLDWNHPTFSKSWRGINMYAFYSIIKIISLKKYSWIGENKLVNWCHEQITDLIWTQITRPSEGLQSWNR